MKVIASVCGSSAECAEELKGLAETVRQIDEAAARMNISVPEDHGFPLIESALRSGPDDIIRSVAEAMSLSGIEADEEKVKDALLGKVREEELFTTYVARRILGSALKRAWPKSWERGTCPVCGLIPLAAKEVSRSEVTSALSSLVLKCLCGYEWEWGYIRCPSCGESSPEGFDMFIMGSLVIYSCKSCRHKLAVARGEVSGEEWEAMPLISYIAIEAAEALS